MADLKNLLKTWRDNAHTLRCEVERGVALRQSAESKLSRAQVLETVADQLERALTSSPWIPIDECGELERGRYLVQLRSGAQIVALWSGDSEGWVLRQRDLDEFDSPRDITHVHQMGPIRGPEKIP